MPQQPSFRTGLALCVLKVWPWPRSVYINFVELFFFSAECKYMQQALLHRCQIFFSEVISSFYISTFSDRAETYTTYTLANSSKEIMDECC